MTHAGFTGTVPAELEKGNGFTERFRVMSMTLSLKWRVTELQPPRLVEMVASGPAGLTITARYELVELEGGTHLTMRSRFSGGPAETAFAPMMERTAQHAADQAVTKLVVLLN